MNVLSPIFEVARWRLFVGGHDCKMCFVSSLGSMGVESVDKSYGDILLAVSLSLSLTIICYYFFFRSAKNLGKVIFFSPLLSILTIEVLPGMIGRH